MLHPKYYSIKHEAYKRNLVTSREIMIYYVNGINATFCIILLPVAIMGMVLVYVSTQHN